MSRHRWRMRACLVLALTLIPVPAPWAVDLFWCMHQPDGATRMTKKMKTVCVGRFLIDVPATAQFGPYAFLNFSTSTLLKGHRTINGVEGDGFAFKARERNLTTGYAFDRETQGTGANVLRPFVSLELQTGTNPEAGGPPVHSTLSEESVGELWRRMSSSLRLHSVAATPAPPR
jgi:hypothetical protein